MNQQITSLIHALENKFLELNGTEGKPHNMGGREFAWREKEIGHIHWNGDLDILFNKRIRDQLIAAGIVETHKWVPDSGWTTFRVLTPEHLGRAVDLLHLSFLLKTKKLDRARYEEEREQLLAPVFAGMDL
ncbi:MAG: DUF5519 family protein [Bacteroidia bacterium]|nr:DUF5519 family protein [Bacteroidia bacterium]